MFWHWDRKLSTIILCFFLCASIPLAASGRDWLIDSDGSGDVETIQDGIDAAENNDRIVLTPGTFRNTGNRDIDFLGKAIEVTSQGGPGVTTIDCENSGRAFIFQNGEGPSSIVSGITIENGYAIGFGQYGGAIYCDGASPTIDGNVIGSCQSGGGGGIACNNGANPTITNNQIIDNYSGDYYASDGGGIWIHNSSPTIMYNVISNNQGQSGGGIYCDMFTGPQISWNLISYNGAVNEGGGIWSDANDVTITNNIIYHNQASGGGGLWVGRGPAVISGNTLCENSGVGVGGLYIGGGAFNCSVERTIIAFSTDGDGVISGDGATFTCCLVYGNAGSNDLSFGIDGGNNLFVDPQFCGVLGSGILSLQDDSPAAAANNDCFQNIGALGAECGMTARERSTWGGLKSLYK
jgi:hypothetical protein